MAGNTELIDEIIDTAATSQQYDTLSKQLQALDDQFVSLTKDVIAFTKAAGDAKGFTDFNTNAAKAAIAQQKIIDTQNKGIIVSTKLAQEQQRLIDLEAKAAASKNRLEQSSLRLATAQEKASQTAQKAASPYQQLSKELDTLRAKAKDTAVQFGINSKEFAAAQKPVQELDARLKTIDKTLGQNQRNVGNYEQSVKSALETFYNEIDRAIPGMGRFTRTVVEGFGAVSEKIKGTKNDVSNFLRDGIGFKPQNFGSGEAAEITTINTTATEANTEANKENAVSEAERAKATGAASEAVEANTTATAEGTEAIGTLSTGFAAFSTLAFVAAIGAATYYLSQFRSTGETVSAWFAGIKNVVASAGEQIVNQITNTSTEQEKAVKKMKENMTFWERAKYNLTHLTRASQGGTSITDAYKAGKDAEETKQRLQHITELDEAENASLQAEAERLRALSKDKNTELTIRQKYLKDAQEVEQKILDNQKKNAKTTIDASITLNQKLNKLSADQVNRLQGGDLPYAQGLSLNGRQFTTEAFELYKTGIQKKIAYETDAANQIVRLQADRDNMELRADNALAKAQDRLDKARIERSLETAKETLDNDRAGYAEKLKANRDFLRQSIALIENEKKNQLDSAGLGGTRSGKDSRTEAVTRAAIEEEAQNKIIKIRTEAAGNIIKIQKQINDEVSKDQKRLLDEEIGRQKQVEDLLLTGENEKLIALDSNYSKEVSAATKLYAQGEIDEDEYNKKLLKLKQDYGAARIQTEIDIQKKILEAQLVATANGVGDPKAIQSSADKLAKLQIEATNQATNTELENIKKVEEAKKQLEKVEQEIAANSIQLIQSVIDGGYQNELRVLERRKEIIDQNAASEKAVVERGLLSAKEKAAQERVIDAQALSQKEAIAAKERQIKNAQAKFDRDIAIANTIEQTALAVVSALKYPPPFGEELAIAVGILGAVQLAKIVATPVPKYAVGTGNHPGGHAIVGEIGPELIQYPNGNSILSPGTATLMNLPAGTVVKTHKETMKALTGGELDTRQLEALLKESNSYQKRIAEKPNGYNKNLAYDIALATEISNRRNAYFK